MEGVGGVIVFSLISLCVDKFADYLSLLAIVAGQLDPGHGQRGGCRVHLENIITRIRNFNGETKTNMERKSKHFDTIAVNSAAVVGKDEWDALASLLIAACASAS